jgi:hypothetical protein
MAVSFLYASVETSNVKRFTLVVPYMACLRAGFLTKATRRLDHPIEPMDLANMRENAVRSLAVQCHQCRHAVTMNVEAGTRGLTSLQSG